MVKSLLMCDQTGRFLKVLDNNFSNKNGPKLRFGLFWIASVRVRVASIGGIWERYSLVTDLVTLIFMELFLAIWSTYSTFLRYALRKKTLGLRTLGDSYENLALDSASNHWPIQYLQSTITFLMCISRPLFSLFSSFEHLTVNMFIIKICCWLDSNHGPLVSESTVLPTEHHCPNIKSVNLYVWTNWAKLEEEICFRIGVKFSRSLKHAKILRKISRWGSQVKNQKRIWKITQKSPIIKFYFNSNKWEVDGIFGAWQCDQIGKCF